MATGILFRFSLIKFNKPQISQPGTYEAITKKRLVKPGQCLNIKSNFWMFPPTSISSLYSIIFELSIC
jgi:hypothetical protein